MSETIEEKAGLGAQHLQEDTAVQADNEGLLKSRFDHLPLLQTLWIFRRAAVYCFISFTWQMLDGWEVNLAGTIIANKGFIQQFGKKGGDGSVLDLDTSWVSAWSAIVNVGQIVSLTFGAYFGNRFGRKNTFYLTWVIYVVGLALLTAARSPPVWLIGKLFVGMGAGLQQLVTGPYLMEIAPNRIRGGLLICSAAWSSIGNIVCNAMIQVVNQRYPLYWQLPVYVIWGPVGVVLILVAVLPESPWYLARHNNKEAAFKALRRLYGNVAGFDVEEEYGIIERTLALERHLLTVTTDARWRDIVTGLNLRRTVVLIILTVGGQLAGLTMIGTFATYFYSIAGLTDPFLASLIQSIIGLVSLLLYALVTDRIGRRLPVTICYSTMCILVWLMGAIYYAKSSAAHRVLLVFTCLYQACFTVEGNSYYLLAAELPSAQLRLKTATLANVCGAIFGVATSFAVPPMLVALNLRAGFIFGAFSLPVAIYLWYFLPEPKGRSAAEIDELFETRVPAWRWSRTKTRVEERTEAVVAMRRAEGKTDTV